MRFSVDPDDVAATARVEFGVSADRGRLESALAAPFHTFGGRELFPEIHEKVAVLFRSMIKDHPFSDGNKRMAINTVLRFVAVNGMRIKDNEDITLRLLALLVASDVRFKDQEMDYLKAWFHAHIIRKASRPPRIG